MRRTGYRVRDERQGCNERPQTAKMTLTGRRVRGTVLLGAEIPRGQHPSRVDRAFAAPKEPSRRSNVKPRQKPQAATHVIRESAIPMIRHQRTPHSGRAPRQRISAAPRRTCLPCRPTSASSAPKVGTLSPISGQLAGLDVHSKYNLSEARLLNLTFVQLRLMNDESRRDPDMASVLPLMDNSSPRTRARCSYISNEFRTTCASCRDTTIRATTGTR